MYNISYDDIIGKTFYYRLATDLSNLEEERTIFDNITIKDVYNEDAYRSLLSRCVNEYPLLIFNDSIKNNTFIDSNKAY